MNDLMAFESPTFGQIRALTIDGEPWLVGKDVATALGYSDPKAAIRDHVDDEDKQVIQKGQIAPLENHIPKSALPLNFVCADIPNRGLTIINESGVYSLVFSSKLESAKAFKRWVTHEVLPSIRRNGGYIAGQETMTDAELLAKAVLVADRQIKQRDARIAELSRKIEADAPAVLFAGAVSVSNEAILIGELAKILKQNGVENMGQNRLFERLRRERYLISRKGTDYNMPTQRSMELGLFVIKETAITHSDGHVTVSKTVKVTGKGQIYFVNHFLGGANTA